MMSERRMFTQKITESDAFLEMPASTQNYYFHLCMNADDDGFVKNPKIIARMVGASEDDGKILITKRFIIPFESGVIVIKHWRMHNLLRKDRYKETEYLEEKALLYIKNNESYTLDKTQGQKLMATKWQPNGNQMAPQDRIGKVSIDKDNKDDDISASLKRIFPNLESVEQDCELRNINLEELTKKVEESDYLKSFEVLRVSWLNKNFEEIMSGKYKTFEVKKTHSQNFDSRNYTKEELREVISSLDDVTV